MKRITNLGGDLVEPKIETSLNRPDSKSYFNTKFFDFQRIHAYPKTKNKKLGNCGGINYGPVYVKYSVWINSVKFLHPT